MKIARFVILVTACATWIGATCLAQNARSDERSSRLRQAKSELGKTQGVRGGAEKEVAMKPLPRDNKPGSLLKPGVGALNGLHGGAAHAGGLATPHSGLSPHPGLLPKGEAERTSAYGVERAVSHPASPPLPITGVRASSMAGNFGHKNYGPAVVGGPSVSGAKTVAGINGTTLRHRP